MKDTSKAPAILENVEITDAGSEGMAVGRVNEQVVFVPFAVPGDIVDVRITRRKKRYLEAKIVAIRTPSPRRIDPFCSHFGICGGCRWQNMAYEDQLYYKEKQVTENLVRIGKLTDPLILPILPSQETRFYRNKLDYTFSTHRWLTDRDMTDRDPLQGTNSLGFHVPGFFDKVVDIENCYHQPDPSNAIRNEARRFALACGHSFYDVRKWQGFLRNLIIRSTLSGRIMIILVVRHEEEGISLMLDHLQAQFPAISSSYFVINPKQNDSLQGLEFRHYGGDAYLTETMPAFGDPDRMLYFRIGPASFFQTNTRQAFNLYHTAAEFAELTGQEHVWDLYTGTGTIANYVAARATRVTGIESVGAAIDDARINASINGITNTTFIAGEAEKVLTPDFIEKNGRPDIIITDPPRNGMHEKVIATILLARPTKVVYVSCNPATQARDIAMMKDQYDMEKCQPVDMFPHTQHVESVALLRRVR